MKNYRLSNRIVDILYSLMYDGTMVESFEFNFTLNRLRGLPEAPQGEGDI